MKKQILVLLAVIGFLMSSCDREELYPDSPYFGLASAKCNGNKWKANIYSISSRSSQNHLSIIMRVHNKQGYARETIVFEGIEKRVGYTDSLISQTEPILKYARYSTLAADGNVGCDYYNVLDSSSNYLILSKYDEKSGKIEGSFNVLFIIDKTRDKCDTTAPDTIQFTEGVFFTKIQD